MIIQYQGFYYDAYYGSLGLNDEHLKKIESEAEKAVKVLFMLLSKCWMLSVNVYLLYGGIVAPDWL